ncbi:Glutamyl aminopeptidase [Araneus ventricosus]|uniref:Glutamyl aminopeptidase n=1 Tax=Araneus ventricosus TaxID=182803 RepID=A0A4Y2P1B8_ARAVE|nr:Glutamyl aminopeptidase [Araneus ventricosus]
MVNDIMKVLSNTSWGADKVLSVRIYRYLVRSKLDYGAPVYGSAAKSTLKILVSVHHQGLRIATGAFRTTPIHSLHVISGEPSLELGRHRLSLSTFYKIKSNEFHPQHYKVINPIFGSLFSVRLSFTQTSGFRIGEILRYFEIGDFSIISNVEGLPPWQETPLDFSHDILHFVKLNTSDVVFQQHFYDHRQRYSDYVPTHTDGSKYGSHVNSAVVLPDFTISETLHPFCSVYTFELYAIYLRLLKISTLNFKKKAIIYTDSRSGINTLRSTKHNNHPLVMKCFDLHHTLKNTKIRYCCIPGHAGIPGNENADKAEKTSNATLETFVRLIDALQTVKFSQHRIWQRIWDRQTNNKLYNIQPSIKVQFDLPVTNSEWVKFNVNQTGYYLVNYESHDWKLLTELLLTNHEALTPSDRSNLLFDSFMLAQAGHIGLDVFLSMSVYLKRESDLTPWQTASTCFGSMAELLKNTEADLLLKSYVSGLADDIYKTLGWNSSEGHTENLLRTTVMSLACSAGHQDCLTQASERFNNWTTGNETSLPLKNIVFKYGISSTSVEENWNYMWNRYLTEQSPGQKKAYLTNLGNVKIPHLITRYLDFAMDETKIRSQDFFTVLNSEMENPVGRPIVWNFIREKWPELVERFTLNSRYLGNFVNRICSTFTTERELQEMQEFFAKYPDAGAGRRGRLQALETVQYNIHWIKTQASEVRDWLLTEIPSPWRYHRLPTYVIPEHYDLALYPMLDKDIFNGTVTITVTLKKSSDCFLVHSVKLNISQTRVISEEDAKVVELEDVFEYKENGFLVLKVKRKLPVGKYKLYFEFQGPFVLSLEGLYKSSYVDPDTGERR